MQKLNFPYPISLMIPVGTQVELSDPPKDGISSLSFGSDTDSSLLSVYLYDAQDNRLKVSVPCGGAQLDACYGSSEAESFVGGLDRQVLRIDWVTLKTEILGTHQEAVKCLKRSSETGLLFSGSWDASVTAWDTRAMSRVQNISLPGKVYTMDTSGNMLVIGMAAREIYVYDVRKLEEPLQRRESSLKYQTRCIRCSPDGAGFVCASIEGRVAVDYFDPSEDVQASKYAFKCHRAPAPPGLDPEGAAKAEIVYPVNAIAFHPVLTEAFLTGGSDGVVNVWDRRNKKRLRQYPKLPTSISALSFNRDGSLLAIASSYCYEEGEKDHPLDSIFIRAPDQSEFKTKPKETV